MHSGRTDMLKAALHRLKDAKYLLEGGEAHARAAAYLAGYAVECKLKAVAMEVHKCWTLEALEKKRGLEAGGLFTHNLEVLVGVTQRLSAALKASELWPAFRSLLNTWTPMWRYDPRPYQLDRAHRFVRAAERFTKWLEANRA